MKMMRAAAVLVALASGCAAPYNYMTPVNPPQPLAPPPNSGMVVFVRPSTWGGGLHADIVDENGHFIGRTTGAAHFAAAMPPGPHMFAIWGENTDVVEVDVAPGHIYFVEVGITPGWMSAQFHLYAITPKTTTWPTRDQWVRDTKQMRVDPAGQSLFNGREKDVAERLRRAREHLQKYANTPEQNRHFIAQGDGI
jgi:hypothetical protein